MTHNNLEKLMSFVDKKISKRTLVRPNEIINFNKNLKKYDNKMGVKEYRENLKAWLENWVEASGTNKNYLKNKSAMKKYNTIQNKREQILNNYYEIKTRTNEQRVKNQEAVKLLARKIFIRNLTTISRNTKDQTALANALNRVMQSDFGNNKVMGVSTLKNARNATNPENKSELAKKGAILFLQSNVAKKIMKNNGR